MQTATDDEQQEVGDTASESGEQTELFQTVMPPWMKEIAIADSEPTGGNGEFDDKFEEYLEQQVGSEKVSQVQELLHRWDTVFSQHDLDLGHATKVQHRIRLTSDQPFKERPRRIPPAMIEEVCKHLQEMLELGVIKRSESPYASNIVLVRKKDGSLRFCIDLRRLNSLTVRDAYSLPRIDDTLDALQGAKWFSTVILLASRDIRGRSSQDRIYRRVPWLL